MSLDRNHCLYRVSLARQSIRFSRHKVFCVTVTMGGNLSLLLIAVITEHLVSASP